MDYPISQLGLIAAEDAYDEVATEPFEQINRCAVEAAIKAYLAADPALTALFAVKARLETLAVLDDEDKRSENPEDRMFHQGRAAGLRMAAWYLP